MTVYWGVCRYEIGREGERLVDLFVAEVRDTGGNRASLVLMLPDTRLVLSIETYSFFARTYSFFSSVEIGIEIMLMI